MALCLDENKKKYVCTRVLDFIPYLNWNSGVIKYLDIMADQTSQDRKLKRIKNNRADDTHSVIFIMSGLKTKKKKNGWLAGQMEGHINRMDGIFHEP